MPKKTFEAARRAKVTLITQLKDNQETLRKQVEHGVKISKAVDRFDSEWELGHGRIEQRSYEVFQASQCLQKFSEWKEIHQMIRVRRIREIKGGRCSMEESFYVCNNPLSAREYSTYIRAHWGIENKLNYIKDLSFLEDKMKRRINPVNFSTCISFALNIIRRKINSKIISSIRGLLYENSMELDGVLKFAS